MISLSKNTQGFSMIETLFALSIMGLVLASMMKSVVSSHKASNKSMIYTNAAFAAQSVIDELRFQKISGMPMTGSEQQLRNIDEIDFNVIVNYCLNSSYCSALDTRHVSLTVFRESKEVYSTQTVYTQFE